MTLPRYHIPVDYATIVLWDIVRGRRRSISADAEWFLKKIGLRYRLEGIEHIPARGAALVLMNHYTRPGLDAWWVALCVALAVARARQADAPREVQWIMASEWTFDDLLRTLVKAPVSRVLLPRIARTYGLITVAPAVLGPLRATDRADSIRRYIALAREAARRGGLLGLAPEGGDTPHPDRSPAAPPKGAGRFMLLLAQAGLPFLPVGLFEEDDVLVARFGETFDLAAPRGMSKDDLDAWASREVMGRIARLLPVGMRGEFG